MKPIVTRVSRLDDRLNATREEHGILLKVMPAGYEDLYPDQDCEISELQDAGLLPRTGVIVLPDGVIKARMSAGNTR